MNDRDRVRFHHMLDAAREAQSFVAGVERTELDHNRLLVLALIRLIETIGEAASQVSGEGHREIQTLPWAEINGMRNRLIHAYFDVDLDRIWDTVVDDLPPLVQVLESVVSTEQ